MIENSTTLYEFAWSTLTDNKRYRIRMMYELKNRIKNLEDGQTKRSVYRIIAERFPGFSVNQIEYIYNHNLNR